MSMDDTELQSQSSETELIIHEADPLTVDLEDKMFVDVVDKLIQDSRSYFSEKKDLYARRSKNVEYYLGQTIRNLEKKGELADHQARYADNLVWEGEATLKPIALSRIPDLSVEPGNESEESKEIAKSLTGVINSDLRKRENRTVLGRAYRHRPIYFIGVIKVRWDPSKGKHGDYVFEAIHPDNIDVDHTATDNDVNKMKWVAHHYNQTVKELIMKFPDKKDELFKELAWTDEQIEAQDEKMLASTVRISEVHYTWWKNAGKEQAGEDKWERLEGIAWKYKKLLFKNMLTPNWDWEGQEQYFTFDESKDEGKQKTVVGQDMFRQAMMPGMEEQAPFMLSETIYHNHLENPEKPFIFIGYDQLGMMPFDETSRIEQTQYLQDSVNIRGAQITQMAATAWGKDVYSTESGLEKKDIQKIDKTDPKHDVLVQGKLTDVYMHIDGTMPDRSLFEEQAQNRERVFSKMGAHATTRGEREADETATGRQLLKEADFGKQDDEVEETINYAAEKMANWSLQFIKLRYTEEHLKRLKGEDGKVIFAKVKNDMVEDGMEVMVAASGVDKQMRKQEAFERAKMQMSDPLSFFNDTEATDPKGRAERLILFMIDPRLYYQKFLQEQPIANPMDPMQQGAALNGVAPGQGGQKAMMDIALLQQGQMPQPPQPLDPLYIQTINRFLQSPEFQQLPPNIQQVAVQYAQQLAQLAQAAPQTPPQAPVAPQAPPTPGGLNGLS